MAEGDRIAAGPALVFNPRFLGLVLVVFAGLIAIADLMLGWVLGIEFFTRIRPGYPAMVPESAACIVLAANGVLSAYSNNMRGVRLATGTIIFLIIVQANWAPIQAPGLVTGDRMSLATLMALVALSASLMIRWGLSDRTLRICLSVIYFAHLTNRSERRAAAAEAELYESERARQASELAAVRAQKVEAMGQLVGGVAHDFNNTLTVIIGNLELLQEVTDDESRRYCVDEAITASNHPSHLTRQLLAYGRRSRLEPLPSVLDDLVMPSKLQGHDLALHIRETWPGIRILLMSGYESARRRSEEIALVGVPFLQKPIDRATLRVEVAKSLGGQDGLK